MRININIKKFTMLDSQLRLEVDRLIIHSGFTKSENLFDLIQIAFMMNM